MSKYQITEVKELKRHVTNDELEEFLLKRELSGITSRHLKEIKRTLMKYLHHINFNINKKNTLTYFQRFQKKYSIAYYNKSMYQILLFLDYLGITWHKDIRLPANPVYQPRRITRDNIHSALQYFASHTYYCQFKAVILLGATSGLRAEEIYQLTHEDIDLEKRMVHIRHKPKSGQRTKTGKSRISFFNQEAKDALIDYFEYYQKDDFLTVLFGQSHLNRAFHDAPFQVKDLRKFFSQEWDRQGGPTSTKKMLMGHSLKRDVDLLHYNYQSEEDLKKIYDKVDIRIY